MSAPGATDIEPSIEQGLAGRAGKYVMVAIGHPSDQLTAISDKLSTIEGKWVFRLYRNLRKESTNNQRL
jgi:hypothetical protein